MENPEELAIAHAVTEEEVLSYLIIARPLLAPLCTLLVKQACLLRDRGFDHSDVMRWLYYRAAGAPIAATLLDAISRHLANP